MGVHDNRSCVSLLVNCIFSAWFAWKVQRVDGLWQTDKFIHRMENWLRPYPQAFFHDFIKRGQWGSFKIIQVNAIKKKRTDAQRILKCKPEMLSWIAFYWFGQASMRMQTNLLYTITLHVLFFLSLPLYETWLQTKALCPWTVFGQLDIRARNSRFGSCERISCSKGSFAVAG